MTTATIPGPPPPLPPRDRRAVTALAARGRSLAPRRWAPLAAAGSEWIVMILAAGSTVWISHPAWWIAMATLIATRQHGLLVLMHEGVHRRIHPDAARNDLLSDLLCAWPMFVTTAGYRVSHLQHHRALHTPEDPDWQLRHDRSEWAYPRPGPQILSDLAKMGLGGGIAALLRSNARLKAMGLAFRPLEAHPLRRLARGVVTLAIPVGGTLLGEGLRVGVLWVLPFVTILPVLIRVRVIGEHYGLPATSVLDTTRDWTAGPVLDWLLVPWNIRLHLTHHLFPGVPFAQLPAMHRMLRDDPVLGDRCHWTRGIAAFARELTGS